MAASVRAVDVRAGLEVTVARAQSHGDGADLVEIVVDLALHRSLALIVGDERLERVRRLGAITALIVERRVRVPGLEPAGHDDDVRAAVGKLDELHESGHPGSSYRRERRL